MTMKILLSIGIGGFFGSIFRYGLTRFVQNKWMTDFPLGTYSVNMLGCFLIGILFALTQRSLSPEWRVFLITGFCGSFTTFSTFSADILALFRNDHLLEGGAYMLGSVFVGLVATYLGIVVVKLI